MGLEEQLREQVLVALDTLAEAGTVARAVTEGAEFNAGPPPKGGQGDVATNVAMVLSKRAGMAPKQLADAIAAELRRAPVIREVAVAGPGFINVSFAPAAFHAVLEEISREGRAYGRARSATKERVNLEFVSANPTGPLLISHGRGAVLGDAVGRLLEATGYRVTREYYINDFGNQVRMLGDSVLAAARGAEPPEGGYGGFYVEELAQWVKANRAELLEIPTDERGERFEELKRACILLMIEGIPGSESYGIRRVLAEMGIEFDVWTSEEALHRWGKVERALAGLEAQGRLEEKEGAVFFKAENEEDDKDRVVRKKDGSTTYYASDIAYHADKLGRGFERMINVWGADHHGYIARMKNGVQAVGGDPARLEVLLFQLVSLLREGKPVRMGKRRGNIIPLQDVMEEIDEAVGNPAAGRDAIRFFFLSKKSDTPITMDLDLAKKQETENPVFYVQMGHARLCSIQRRGREEHKLEVPRYSSRLAARVEHPLELKLIALLGRYPAVVAEAASARDPHKVVTYLQAIAGEFQSYYTLLGKGARDTILPQQSDMAAETWPSSWDWEKTRARLLWVDAIRTVYASGLELLGLTAPERMVRVDEASAADPGS